MSPEPLLRVLKGAGAFAVVLAGLAVFVVVAGLATVIWPVVAPPLILWWALTNRSAGE